MKLLLDQGLPRSTVSFLESRGIAAEHVGDLGMSQSSDEAILREARNLGAVVATLDADFHAILARSHASSPSAIRIRIEGLRGEELAEILARVILQVSPELEAGAAVSVDEHRIRLRLLPIGR